MCELDADLETGSCPGNGLHRVPDLTRLHAIDRVIAYFLIYNKNIACNGGTRLDCCDVNVTPSDYDIAIITLDRLCFVLSCRLAPSDALSLLCGRRAGSDATCVLTLPHLSSRV
jgi:hypothetical protein